MPYGYAPPVPTSRRARAAILDLVGHYAAPGPLLDLGCGYGTLARDLARAFPDRAVLGVEVTPLTAGIARHLSRAYPNLSVIQGAAEEQVTGDPWIGIAVTWTSEMSLGRIWAALPATTILIVVDFAFSPEDGLRLEERTLPSPHRRLTVLRKQP